MAHRGPMLPNPSARATQAQVSALLRCKPVSVSVGRLMEFLNVLGQDVEVTVKPARRTAGDMSVIVPTM